MISTNKALKNSRDSWILFIVTFTLWSILFMSKNCFNLSMAAIVSEGFLTKSQTSLITAVFWFIYAIGQVVGGVFADRKPPQHLFLIGTLGAAVINLGIFFFYKSYAFMMISWSLNAALQFAAWPAVFKIVSTKLLKKHRSNCIFITSLSNTVGLMLGYVLSALVSKWQINFLISSVLLFLLSAVFLFTYSIMSKRMQTETLEVFSSSKNSNVVHEAPWSLFKKSGFVFICIGAFLTNTTFLAPKSLAPTMLVESYSSMTVSLANTLNAFIIGTGVLSIFVGKMLYPKHVKNEVLIVSVALGLSLPFLALTVGTGKISIIVIILGLIFGLFFINTAYTFIFSHMPTKFNAYGIGGMVAGLLNAMAALGNVVASYLFAAIADSRGGWLATTIAWSVCALLACFVFTFIIKIWKRFISNQ